MRRSLILALGIGSFGALAASFLSTAEAVPAVVTDTKEARAAMALANEQALRARQRASELDAKARTATVEGDRATLAVAAMAARVQQSEAGLAAAEARVAVIAAERQRLDSRLARERAPVTRLLAGLQAMVRRPAVMSLMQPGSLEDTVHLRAVLTTIGPQIGKKTEGLRSDLARTRTLERDAEKASEEQRARGEALIARRRELEAVVAKQRLAAGRAAGSADRETERAFAMAEQARSLGALVRRFESATPQGQRHRAGETPGKPFAAPVQGPVLPPVNRSEKSIGYLAAPGSLVLAPGDGKVAFAGKYRGYGEVVILDHADDWTSLLTGMSEADVVAGQRVVTGSPLGRTGTRASEVTIELRRSGSAVRSSDYIR